MATFQNDSAVNEPDNKVTITTEEENARKDFLDTVYIQPDEQLDDNDYGHCEECREPNTSHRWCNPCNARHFKEEFTTWTSDNREIDLFIQNTQLYAYVYDLALQWIPYTNFINVTKIGKGGYGTVYSAEWTGGLPITHWNSERKKWHRQDQKEKVALKAFENSKNAIRNLMNEVKMLYRFSMRDVWGRNLFGVTKNPENGQYLLVLAYAKNGNLREYLHKGKGIPWQHKLDVVWNIVKELDTLHSAGLIHRDLHPGNILNFDFNYTRIADLGLSIHESQASTIYDVDGVMPFIAPELFFGSQYSQASDIYAFGILMWEISTEELPFDGIPHNHILAIKIHNGLRPTPAEDTPQFYQEIMQRCWNSDPEKRPKTKELCDTIKGWTYSDEWSPDMRSQIRKAEDARRRRKKSNVPSSLVRPEEIHTSRTMPTISDWISKTLSPLNPNFDYDIDDFLE